MAGFDVVPQIEAGFSLAGQNSAWHVVVGRGSGLDLGGVTEVVAGRVVGAEVVAGPTSIGHILAGQDAFRYACQLVR